MILYPQVDAQEWIDRHKLEAVPNPCLKCKVIFPYTIPVASKNWRGITQQEHGCGKEYTQTILTPIGKEKDEWMELLK